MNLLRRLKKITGKNNRADGIQAQDIFGFLLINLFPKYSELKFLKKNL